MVMISLPRYLGTLKYRSLHIYALNTSKCKSNTVKSSFQFELISTLEKICLPKVLKGVCPKKEENIISFKKVWPKFYASLFVFVDIKIA
jgi:hypothetical protein